LLSAATTSEHELAEELAELTKEAVRRAREITDRLGQD
jgi:hypothetical protein